MPSVDFAPIPPAGEPEKPKKAPRQTQPKAEPTSTSTQPLEVPTSPFGVNLMAEELRKKPDITTTTYVRAMVKGLVVGALLLGVLAGGAYAYTSYVSSQLQSIRQELATVDGQIGELEKDRTNLTKFQSRLTSVRKLLDGHVYWSKFFEGVERNTLPDVVYAGVTANDEYSVTLNSLAQNYATVARQILAFQEDTGFITAVKMESANTLLNTSGKVVGVKFSLVLSVNPAALTATGVVPPKQ